MDSQTAMSNKKVEFIAITGAENDRLADQFLEMAGDNLEIAISLFFEHGGNSQLGATTNGDDELAQRLQDEAYGGDDYVRPPDQATHETLAETHVFPGMFGGYGGSYQHLRGTRDMFDDSRPSGIFNQRYDDDMSDSSSGSSNYDERDSDEEDALQELVEEPVVELDEEGHVREYTRMVPRHEDLSKEEKLARLFRPPFDMISKRNLDSAKSKAKKKGKWIMINVQDSGVFQCQALNRDLWSCKDVKKLIKRNFVFLQYQFDSRNAEPYINFYGLRSKEELPHIAILDPLTGERLKQWNRTVPKPEEFISEIEGFLSNFSLDPKVANPAVKEPTPEPDPTTLTEEQQMELAIKQSLGTNSKEPINISEEQKSTEENPSFPPEQSGLELSPFSTILAVHHEEPPNKPGVTTRIQIRTGDGGKLIRRFNVADPVRAIYETIKDQMVDYAHVRFTLGNHQQEDLIDKLDITIQDAGLRNSSLLLEKMEDGE